MTDDQPVSELAASAMTGTRFEAPSFGQKRADLVVDNVTSAVADQDACPWLPAMETTLLDDRDALTTMCVIVSRATDGDPDLPFQFTLGVLDHLAELFAVPPHSRGAVTDASLWGSSIAHTNASLLEVGTRTFSSSYPTV